MNNGTIIRNNEGLARLRKQLKILEKGRAHVGLLTPTSNREKPASVGPTQPEMLDNPSLGFIHEYGSQQLRCPERSFLRMPLMTQLSEKKLATVPWFEVVRKRGAKRALLLLGGMGEEFVNEAFKTRGYGKWIPLKPATIARKGSSAILIESGQMEGAITSRVVDV